MLKSIKNIIKLNRLVYASSIEQPTKGTINITDSEISLDCNGTPRMIEIIFAGTMEIENLLPQGYSISISSGRIIIINILAKKIKQLKPLFKALGEFEIRSAQITTYLGDKIPVKVENKNKTTLIGFSETKLEDDSLIIRELNEESYAARKNRIDDDTIKGLYTHKELPNGYSGYYNYSPSKRVFSTGKRITNESQLILNPNSKLKNRKSVQTFSKAIVKTLQKNNLNRQKREAAAIYKKAVPHKTTNKKILRKKNF